MSDALVKRLLTQAGVAVLAGVLSSSAVWAEDDASVSGESAVEATDPSTGDTGVASEPAETQESVSDAGENPQVSEEPEVTIDPVYEPEIAICPVEGPDVAVEPVEDPGVTIDVVEEPEVAVDPEETADEAVKRVDEPVVTIDVAEEPEVAVDPEDNSGEGVEPVDETVAEDTPDEVIGGDEEPQVTIDPPFDGEEPILVIDPPFDGEEPELVVDPIFLPEDEVYYMLGATGGEAPELGGEASLGDGEVVVTEEGEQVPVLADDSGMVPDVQPMAETVGTAPVVARSDSDHSDPAQICAKIKGKTVICDAAVN